MLQKIKINIEITGEELRLKLEKLIKSEHASLIADIIINNLGKTEVGLEQLYMGFSGIKKVIPYKVLDEVYVKYEGLHSWYHDKDEMIKEKMLFKGCIKAKIVAIDPYIKSAIKIEYTGKDVDKDPQEYSYFIHERYIYKITPDFIELDDASF